MGFSVEQRHEARTRAQGNCEFEECERPNTGKVNHITGVFEAFLDHKTPSSIRDVTMNSALLCIPHELHHDAQERWQVESLLAERHRGGTIFDRRINSNTRNHRRIK